MYFRDLVLPGTEAHTDEAAVYREVPGIVLKSVESFQRTVLVERDHDQRD